MPPPPERAKRTGRLVRRALAWVVLLGLLAWLARRVSFGQLAGTFHPPPWWAWLAAAAGLATSYLFRGLRIHAELSRRHRVSRAQCLRVMLVHNLAVNLVPMRGGEAAYPLLVNQQLGVPLGQAVASLVWIRTQDMLLLSLLVILFLPGLPVWARAALVVAGLGATLALIARVQRFVARRGEAPAPRAKVLRAALAALEALSEAPRHGLAGWLFGAGSWAVKLAALGFLLSQLGGFPLLDAVTGALGGELAGILPIQGPANFGTYETGVWAGMARFGHSTIDVPAPAFVLHLFSLASAVLFGVVAYALSLRVPARRAPETDHA